MANVDPVRILPRDSPDRNQQQDYVLTCHSHRVRVVVTSKPAVVHDWVSGILERHRYHHSSGRLVVGLGVHWNPRRGRVAATLQLCVGGHCLIFQLVHAGHSPAVLRRFLADPSINFVGLRNYRHATLLKTSRHSLPVTRLVDLRVVVCASVGFSRWFASRDMLAAEILGMRGILKGGLVGRSDWSVARLSAEQVKHASLDAFLVFLMGKHLHVWDWLI